MGEIFDERCTFRIYELLFFIFLYYYIYYILYSESLSPLT